MYNEKALYLVQTWLWAFLLCTMIHHWVWHPPFDKRGLDTGGRSIFSSRGRELLFTLLCADEMFFPQKTFFSKWIRPLPHLFVIGYNTLEEQELLSTERTSFVKTLGVSQTRREGAFSFSWWFLAACYCLLIGVIFDSWAHNHLARLETFFTPWHAILYAGVLATGLVLPGAILLQRMRRGSWKHAIPDGYELAVLGVVGSLIGGLLDMIWHILFGIESNIDAAFSPTHILIMVTFGLTLAGPYRALYTSARPTPKSMLLLSFTLLLSYWSLISQTAHPYTSLWLSTTPKTDEQGQILAIVS